MLKIDMSTKPRTIDNLGVDASIRYAKDKELFEPKFIEESKLVSTKTEIPSLKPYIPSEFERLFSSIRTTIWAAFDPPPESLSNPNSLFSYQLIPSLHLEPDIEPLLFIEDALKKKKRPRKKQATKDKEEEEEEKQTLLVLLECIQQIDKSLALINSRRNQYQRG